MSIAGNVEMERLIPVVNKIQDVCVQMNTGLQFELPQIAVIGSQSAGKSSVLEGFVGRDFLPRGNGTVTRCPLILQLINGPEEYGVFSHLKDKRITNFDEIRTEIANETNRRAGSNKGILDEPIQLSIHSPKVLNLTLIDLPGITRVPIGDQPADIENQTREMVLKYIRSESCLILAVSAANTDLSTSDALKLAKEVDKDGTRTIGVITKLDLMDAGTDARDIFENKLLPLRRGYVGIVNRSQQNIDEQKNIVKALEDEKKFFMQHNYYRSFVDRLGIPYLQKMLNRTLTEHIRDKLPGLQDTLRKRGISLKREIFEYEKSHPTDEDTIKTVTLKVVHDLQSDFQRELGSLGSNMIGTDRLSSGAKIRRFFHENLPNEIAKIQLDEGELRKKIALAIDNLYGKDVIMDVPFKAFEAIVRERVALMKRPILVIVDLVLDELSKAVRVCTRRITDFPFLREKIENTIISFIHGNSPTCKKNVLVLIEMQSVYMNTRHEEFVVNRKPENAKCSPERGKADSASEADNDIISLMHSATASNVKFSDAFNGDNLGSPNQHVDNFFEKVVSYMRIVEKTTIDMIPKAITLYIINELENFITLNLSLEIVNSFGTNITQLLAADPASVESYEGKKKMHDTCETVLDEMNQIGISSNNGGNAKFSSV